MSSNPLTMGHAGWCCLCRWAGRRAEPVDADCGWWPERPGAPVSVTRAR